MSERDGAVTEKAVPFNEPPKGLRRANQRQRDDGLSTSMQVAKGAEHLVCADLLLKGWNAFLADAGLPYDVVVDLGPRFVRLQIKSTTKMYSWDNNYPTYRFAIRRSRTQERRVSLNACNFLAFVALDRRLIAYMPAGACVTRGGLAKTLIEFKTRQIEYPRRGTRGVDPGIFGKFIEDFADFRPDGAKPFPLPWTDYEKAAQA